MQFELGVKRGRGVTLTTHPHLVPSSRMSLGYFLSPLAPAWRSGTALLLKWTFVVSFKSRDFKNTKLSFKTVFFKYPSLSSGR
jgi:hypothetical protein